MSNAASLAGLFLRRAQEHPDRDFLHWRDGEEWRSCTYGEFAGLVRALAARLVAAGVPVGARAVILAENRREWLLADLACLAIGAVDVPIYPSSPVAEVAPIVRRSGATVAFVSGQDQEQKLEGLCAPDGPLRVVLSFDPTAEDPTSLVDTLAEDPGLPHAEVQRRLDALTREDLASILYTSGTTGTPKGVMLTHGNFLSNCEAILQHIEITAEDRTLSFLPLSHCFERTAGHYTLMAAGGQIAYASSVERVPTELKEVAPTLLLGVPRFFEKVRARVLAAMEHSPLYRRKLFQFAMGVGRRVFEARQEDPDLTASLRWRHEVADRLVFARLRERMGGRIRLLVSGGAPLDPEIAAFFNHAGIPLVEGYGLTETSPVVCCNQPHAPRPGSVGPPIPGVEVSLAEDGEVLVRGPNVMRGYFEEPQATARVLDPDGTFHTGDVGFLDEDGFLHLTDRKKDLIITAGGKNVSPAKVALLMKRSPLVADLCLIGDRRPFLVALVVPDLLHLRRVAEERGLPWTHRGEMLRHPALQDLFRRAVARANEELSRPERVRRFCLLEDPFTQENGQLTPTLKVRRRVVEELHARLIHALYAEPGEGPADIAVLEPGRDGRPPTPASPDPDGGSASG